MVGQRCAHGTAGGGGDGDEAERVRREPTDVDTADESGAEDHDDEQYLFARGGRDWLSDHVRIPTSGPREHDPGPQGRGGGAQGRTTSEEDHPRGSSEHSERFLHGDFTVAGTIEESRKLTGSASERLSRQLSLGQARQLEQASHEVAPKIFEGLVSFERAVLLEVACSPQSLLVASVQNLTGRADSASRCASWNKCDLSEPEGLKLILQRIELERPRHVWLSPPSASYSPVQNANQGSQAQRETLREKRRSELKMFISAAVVLHACIQLGIHVTWSWPEHSNAWRLPFMQNLLQKYGLHVAVCKGCRVNARHADSQLLLQKGWRLATTCKRLAEVMQLPCRCDPAYQHGRCLGTEANRTREHTPEFAKRVAQVLLQELSHQGVLEECKGNSGLPESFGIGLQCMCEHTTTKDQHVRCAACVQGMSSDSQEVPGGPTQAAPRQVSQVTKASGSFQGEVSGRDPRPLEFRRVTSEIKNEGPNSLSPEEFEAYMSEEEIQQCEEQARNLLMQRDFKHESCESLLKLLPLKPILKHRRMLGNQRSVYVTYGVYAYGGHYGITRQTKNHKQLCRYLNAYVENWSGPSCRTSLTLSFNNQIPVHKDVNNDERFDNIVVGLGDFKKGGLWLQQETANVTPGCQGFQKRQLPSGDWVPGVIQDIRHRAVRFSPKQWHGSQEWVGNRMVLASYVSRGIHHVSPEVVRELKQYGFNCPPQEVKQMSCVVEPPAPRSERREEEQIMKQLHLLHSATGHSSVRTMIDTLKRRGVSPKVLEVAQRFECSICKERNQPPPRNLASLETLPPKWRTISADIGHWTHPHTGEPVQFMLVIDEGSRFRIARVLTTGSKQQPSAAACLEYLREGWAQVFGQPEVLRLDPAGAFRSEAVESYCDRHSIYLDLIAADAHWQIGVCEQAVKGVKHVMDRLCAADDRIDTKEALSLAVETFNCREQIRGFTPVQHAFGRNPDVTGRLINRPEQVPDELLMESADADFERTAKARASAEKALIDWQAQQRINRAMNSRSRPAYNYTPGELVFFWRTQESGRGRRQPGTRRGRFLGPARVLATETRREADGTLRPGSSVWLVRGRSLLKCCPEQFRRASPREALLESLAHEAGENSTPWTYHRVVEEIGGNRYEDVSQEVPDVREWARAQDPEQETPPPRFRLRGKRAEPEGADVEELPTVEETPSAPSRPCGLARQDPRPYQRSLDKRGGVVSRRITLDPSMISGPTRRAPWRW